MSLSVTNTGYSSSQPQNTTPSDAAQSTDATKIDPLTGKTIEFPASIKVSEETLARWHHATPMKTPSARR
ncbi:hypothetical protein [Dickeya solani]|uniref:Uncharacterized protein n=1 Tax=Dickeya solani TaxID=1089444 RepID=A0AAP8Q3S8_9GAMM|nr:hypothetical protein [Dickeya solani]ANE75922.1 hypothetical protein A4U42_11585 [Dickeya solani IPO 2222]AUC43431.1 hypothetical protein D083_3082 [Dickeya solani RNS 08.23.3.1.A]AUH08670.1 hypothetical protein BJD21_09455 [Dickeya solani D s0432-1]AUH12660.1 hypothetical protein BJJ98_09420 [Dickeya solani]AYQ46352.1 hypothetical protein CTB91_00497 [Dickeya solani]